METESDLDDMMTRLAPPKLEEIIYENEVKKMDLINNFKYLEADKLQKEIEKLKKRKDYKDRKEIGAHDIAPLRQVIHHRLLLSDGIARDRLIRKWSRIDQHAIKAAPHIMRDFSQVVACRIQRGLAMMRHQIHNVQQLGLTPDDCLANSRREENRNRTREQVSGSQDEDVGCIDCFDSFNTSLNGRIEKTPFDRDTRSA